MGFPGGSDGKESACSAEAWVWSLGRVDPLEEGMAMHSSIFAWRIPKIKGAWWAKSMGLQRVRHDWATKQLAVDVIEKRSQESDKVSFLIRTKEHLDESERGEWKSWLAAQHSEN